MPPKLAPLSHMTTREKNKTSHPGVVDLPSPRRTPTQVQEIRREAAKKNTELEEQRQTAVTTVAAIEDKLCLEDKACDLAHKKACEYTWTTICGLFTQLYEGNNQELTTQSSSDIVSKTSGNKSLGM